MPPAKSSGYSTRPSQSDVTGFRTAMQKHRQRPEAKPDSGRDERVRDEQQQESSSARDFMDALLWPEKQLQQQAGDSHNAMLQDMQIGDANKTGLTSGRDFSAYPMSLDHFSLFLQNIAATNAPSGEQWLFSLQDSRHALSKVTLQQVASGHWTISLSADNQAETELLSKNMEKLLANLRRTGHLIESVQMQEGGGHGAS
jgi:preprotein translocase subunit SecD